MSHPFSKQSIENSYASVSKMVFEVLRQNKSQTNLYLQLQQAQPH